MFKVERVLSNVVRPLRHKILRPNLPFQDSILPEDDFLISAHFIVENNGNIVSVASVYKEYFEAIPTRKGYRLRGMATEKKEQGKGFGTVVLKGAIHYLKNETDADIIWCNARVSAFGFYEKMGFIIVGDEFDLSNIGPHKTGYIEV
ncbi:GNAT family N-acetyltransferase [Candidatus Marinimicrobia bacterium]|nr:GNAT family N-acetyltransferase [Candidatus Neomarinimicrobiota bacterium]